MGIKCKAKEIAILRGEKNISVKELSSISNVSVKTIMGIENQTIKPRITTIGKIAKALDVEVRDLIV